MLHSFVWGEGPIPCDYMIVGEAPGAEEERIGRPFVGRSGNKLNLALESAGMSRADVYVTNAYKTRPPNNRTPTQSELDEHYTYLSCELGTIEPRFVLTLGNTALEVMTGEGQIRRRRGEWIFIEDENIHLLPTYHPAYVMRNPSEQETFTADVTKFFRGP